jgi:hypothetical protein
MPVSLNTSKINCLMYADDVILLSETPAGLQNSRFPKIYKTGIFFWSPAEYIYL